MAVQNLTAEQQAEVYRLCNQSELDVFARWEQTLINEAMERFNHWFDRGQWVEAKREIDKASKHQRAIMQYRAHIKARHQQAAAKAA